MTPITSLDQCSPSATAFAPEYESPNHLRYTRRRRPGWVTKFYRDGLGLETPGIIRVAVPPPSTCSRGATDMRDAQQFHCAILEKGLKGISDGCAQGLLTVRGRSLHARGGRCGDR